jgi:hypothetical protein
MCVCVWVCECVSVLVIVGLSKRLNREAQRTCVLAMMWTQLPSTAQRTKFGSSILPLHLFSPEGLRVRAWGLGHPNIFQ